MRDLFRPEAVAARTADREPGAVPEASPPWTWAVPALSATLVLGGAIWLATAHVTVDRRVDAIVVASGGEVGLVVPAATSDAARLVPGLAVRITPERGRSLSGRITTVQAGCPTGGVPCALADGLVRIDVAATGASTALPAPGVPVIVRADGTPTRVLALLLDRVL